MFALLLFLTMLKLSLCFERSVVSCSRMRASHLRMSSSSVAEKQVHVLVPVSKGSEEIETVTIVDTLVRGGAKVTLAAVCPNDVEVLCSRGVRIIAECKMSECVSKKWDMIVCPGGMPGAEYLRDCTHLTSLLQSQLEEGKYIAAICAAPAVVLAHHGLLQGRQATCYPADKFTAQLSNYKSDPVVVDGQLITSQGPGTSLAFSLKLVELLFGKEKAEAVSKEMVF
jgi:4-methyl-5(b-hydroxyethyl)-thiazole monophosphate biosynthesis